jgi:DNA modification methylase
VGRARGVSGPYYADNLVTLWHGDARRVLPWLPGSSVDCIVTSPPYYGLRNYGDEPEQIGHEETPTEYVEAIREVLGACARLLKPTGTCWLNIGDAYSTKPPGGRGRTSQFVTGNRRAARIQHGGQVVRELPEKNLLGLPWRVALALQDDGWILRQEIIWDKPTYMPEAVTDRPTRSHEQIFLLTRSPRYSYDADAIRERPDPAQQQHNERYAREYETHSQKVPTRGQPGNVNSLGIHSRPGKGGRNANSVWRVSMTPSRHEHYAAYPVELPRRCIAAGSPEGGVVLDPFSGTGTTGEAARRLGRHYIGVDTHLPYLDIQVDRFAQAVIA